MNDKPIDLASFEYGGVIYTAPAEEILDDPPLRLLKAFAAGEVTRGGLAEAGWRDIGIIAADGPAIVPPPAPA